VLMSVVAAFSPFALRSGRATFGRTSPYTVEPGSNIEPATNGKLPPETAPTGNPYIRFL
jgi:hypothetical protein